MQLSGQPAKKYLEGVIGTRDWQMMRDDERVEFVKDTLKQYRETARETLKERHPELAGADVTDSPQVPMLPKQSVPRLPAPGGSGLPPGFVIDARGRDGLGVPSRQ